MSIHATKYVYRNYSCQNRKWAVFGRDLLNGSGGILEYCDSPIDARDIIRKMQPILFGRRQQRFVDLKIGLVR